MKYVEISVGLGGPKNRRTLAQIADSKRHSRSIFGKLLLALAAEQTWSKKYTMRAVLSTGNSFIRIHHTLFTRPLVIKDDGTEWTMRRVEDAVRAHIAVCQKERLQSIDALHSKIGALQRLGSRILPDKAMAAICSAFPEAKKAIPLPGTRHGLHAFAFEQGGPDSGTTFVAREVDGEFTGGTVRLSLSAQEWLDTSEGILPGQKCHLFWAALAKRYAAQKLHIPEASLRTKEVCAAERPIHKWQSEGRYTAERAVLRTIDDVDCLILVEFESDMPTSVMLVPDAN